MSDFKNRRKDDVLIGRIDERLKSLDRSFSQHEVEDHNRFELVFGHMKDRFDKIDNKLETLWDLKNSQAGAFSVSRLAGGGIWAIIVLMIDWAMRRMG